MNDALLFRKYGPADLDAQYNNRAAVPEHVELFEEWVEDSIRLLERFEHRLNVAYGSSEAEKLDIIMPPGDGLHPMLESVALRLPAQATLRRANGRSAAREEKNTADETSKVEHVGRSVLAQRAVRRTRPTQRRPTADDASRKRCGRPGVTGSGSQT